MNKVQFVSNRTILEWKILNQKVKMNVNLKYLKNKKFLVNIDCSTFLE